MLSSQGSRFFAAAAAVNDAVNDAVDHTFSNEYFYDLVDAKDGRFHVGTMDLKNTLSRGKAALRTLKKLTTVLNDLLKLSEENVTAIQTKLHPLVLQDGIDSLPDDVLSLVFEYFCADCVDDEYVRMKSPVILSHVSRRFRNLALRLPRLWANINLRLVKSHSQLNIWLSRSKSSRLDLEISGKVPERVFQKISNVATSSRLQTLTFDTNWTGDRQTARLIQKLLHHFRGLSFLDLEHLCIRITECRKDLPLVHLVWDTPNLRSLTAYNIIPELSSVSCLTHCDLSFVPNNSGPKFVDLFRLIHFLIFAPKLKHLALNLDAGFFPNADFQEERPTDFLTHSELESFSLKIRSNANADEYRRLMNLTRFPALSRLSAAFYLADGRALDDWIEFVLFYINDDFDHTEARYPMLEDLTLLLRVEKDTSDPEDGSPLNCISDLTPALKHLTIDAPFIRSPESSYPARPNLRTLTLRRMFDLSQSYVTDLIGRKASGEWDTFEKLEVAGCPDLGLEELEMVIPKAKICWRDRAPKFEDDYYHFTE
ncbi:hypothetical protein DFH11DRAFT_558800 [Phellopilus nigrolimitatus]|nr:hypothetical protein DFH11DRAFT_558800 [Phellopilus nigrolimitatus]